MWTFCKICCCFFSISYKQAQDRWTNKRRTVLNAPFLTDHGHNKTSTEQVNQSTDARLADHTASSSSSRGRLLHPADHWQGSQWRTGTVVTSFPVNTTRRTQQSSWWTVRCSVRLPSERYMIELQLAKNATLRYATEYAGIKPAFKNWWAQYNTRCNNIEISAIR